MDADHTKARVQAARDVLSMFELFKEADESGSRAVARFLQDHPKVAFIPPHATQCCRSVISVVNCNFQVQ